jgi:glycosyltransferase involved in cell wall biosynthesis
MPRVLFVHHRPQPSGAARSLALLIGALGDDWEAHVLVPGGGAAELFEQAGATVHRAPVPAFTHTWDVQYRGLRWLVALRELLWVPAHRRALLKLLRELQPALVHLNDSVLIPSGAVAHRAGIPVIWHLRSSLAHDGRDKRSRWIQRTMDRHGAAAIAIDEDVARTFELTLPIEVIPNPIATEEAPAVELGAPADHVTVGYIGYLRRQKGWPEFLRALRLLIDAGVPVHGVTVGGGVRPHRAFSGVRGRALRALGAPDEEGDFDATLKDLHLERHMTRLPFTSEIGRVYRALDLVVFPNQGAGLGRPVLEAGAYGVPVIASGSPDGAGILLPEDTGILLAQGDPQRLAEAIQRLVEDPKLRHGLGKAASAHARQIAAPEIVGARIESVWRTVLG